MNREVTKSAKDTIKELGESLRQMELHQPEAVAAAKEAAAKAKKTAIPLPRSSDADITAMSPPPPASSSLSSPTPFAPAAGSTKNGNAYMRRIAESCIDPP